MTLRYPQKHNKHTLVDLEPLHCYLQLTEEYLETGKKLKTIVLQPPTRRLENP